MLRGGLGGAVGGGGADRNSKHQVGAGHHPRLSVGPVMESCRGDDRGWGCDVVIGMAGLGAEASRGASYRCPTSPSKRYAILLAMNTKAFVPIT